ncbi:MAG: gamma-glutamylcyclotransferase [Myxococcales bacterium]|nr:gamma-glutamylcyclotransferase [Myxococcales bacterium]
MGLPVVGKAHQAGAGSGPFHWFIYGSSLDRVAFAAWAEQHGYRVPDFAAAIPARLDGHRLAFDVMSRFWGGAVASLAPSEGAFVEGLALPLPAEARGLCDHKEGAISGLYQPFPVAVTPLAGGAPIPALAWRSSPDRRLPSELPPSPKFLDTLVRGAKESGLSATWLTALDALRPAS